MNINHISSVGFLWVTRFPSPEKYQCWRRKW